MDLIKTARTLILEAAQARLVLILRASGYATDAGQCVFAGEITAIGPDDPEQAISVVLGIDTPGRPLTQVPIQISALARADIDEPWLAAEAILGDIRTAMETTDRTLGGLVKTMEKGSVQPYPREPGSTVVGVTITYLATYVDWWGHL